MMYIGAAAGKRNSGTGGARGADPLGSAKFCEEQGSCGDVLRLGISIPWKKNKGKR